MTKNEITRKFDEIIEFSGIAAFIDTPVKRYSSGMYVRLAFSIAAHLEPEILIVDEVLAVGDADFQAKSLQRMREFASNGERAVVFVSHNLHSVNSLCSHAMWLQQGRLIETGDTRTIVNKYLHGGHQNHLKQSWSVLTDAPGTDEIRMASVELKPHTKHPHVPIDTATSLDFSISWHQLKDNMPMRLSIQLFTQGDECVFDLPTTRTVYNKGLYEANYSIPAGFLSTGSYLISVEWISESGSLFLFRRCIEFDVVENAEEIIKSGKPVGFVRPAFPVTIKPVATDHLAHVK
jgi:lipopolysaccharide transport system ATP-binding protein